MVEGIFNRFVTAVKEVIDENVKTLPDDKIPETAVFPKPAETPAGDGDSRISACSPVSASSSNHYIESVPVEDLPLPPSTAPSEGGFSPSLNYTVPAPNKDLLGKSPSFLDRSMDFLKREFDTIRYNFATRAVLTHQQWFNLFNIDGQMLHTAEFYQCLFDYEWPGELLQDAWKYLFEYYPTSANHHERLYIDKCKFEDLQHLIQSWTSISQLDEAEYTGAEEEEGEQQRIKKLIYLINKDVPRTDRDLEFYRSNEENSDILKDLLVTFCFANPDIGYVQGMNDLLSLFLVTVDDKVAAYWSFHNYIMRNKIFFNSTGLMTKLNGIAELLSRHDRELYEKLGTLECQNMLFCQRWILLGFKRECKTFDISVKLFTIINSLQPTHYLTIKDMGRCELLSLDMFLSLAVLLRHRTLLLSYTDQTDVYQWVGQLKIADMSLVYHAKQLYETYEEEEMNCDM